MWLELLRERPALAADLLDCVRSGLVPAFSQVQLESGDLSEHAPAMIVEVQLRTDQRKHLSWPARSSADG
jgi:hypothetical protein